MAAEHLFPGERIAPAEGDAAEDLRLLRRSGRPATRRPGRDPGPLMLCAEAFARGHLVQFVAGIFATIFNVRDFFVRR